MKAAKSAREEIFRRIRAAGPIPVPEIPRDYRTRGDGSDVVAEMEEKLVDYTAKVTHAATAADVPTLWKQRYKDYLGVDVVDYTHGCLQDTHWADGLFGYFPTYALGGAYGAQMRHRMIDEGMDFEGLLAQGDLSPISAWLKDRIWKYGRSKDPDELIASACGEPFDARYYTDYLVEKFSALYGL